MTDSKSLLPPEAFEGTVRLLGWANTSTRGPTISVALEPDLCPQGTHPFAGFEHGKHGQRFRIRFIPILDDEGEVTETGEEREIKKCGALAALLPKEVDFLYWAQTQMPAGAFQHALAQARDGTHYEKGRAVLRAMAGVGSFAELQNAPEARRRLLAVHDLYLQASGKRAEPR